MLIVCYLRPEHRAGLFNCLCLLLFEFIKGSYHFLAPLRHLRCICNTLLQVCYSINYVFNMWEPTLRDLPYFPVKVIPDMISHKFVKIAREVTRYKINKRSRLFVKCKRCKVLATIVGRYLRLIS